MNLLEQVAEPECLGSTEDSKSLVRIRRGENKTTTAHTWFHELVHNLLTALGRDDLNADEGFVDGLAGLLQQAMKTNRGDLYDE
jgi:hypothetical protein